MVLFLRNKTDNQHLFAKGLMFGYASDETEECMPLTVMLAHKLNAKLAEHRRNGTFSWAGPDSKTQVFRLFCSTVSWYSN